MIRVAMTSELSYQRNDAITYFTCSSISRHWELFFQNRLNWSFFLQQPPRCSWSLSEICKSVIETFWEEILMVRNTVKNGQSWWSTVICTKRRAFDMQFHLIVVSILLKTCERSWRYLQPIARKKDLISMYRGALVSGNVNISVFFLN